MKTKYFVDSSGNYLGGYCGAEPPEDAIEIPEPPVDGRMVLTNGVWAMPKSHYAELRSEEYPPIGDQLDALYHAGLFPVEMADKIRAVKEKYPKP